MKLWYKFTEKLPELGRELVIRYYEKDSKINKSNTYTYECAMAVEEYDSRYNKRYASIESGFSENSNAYKSYSSLESTYNFRADTATEEEWCYLEDLCKTLENLND